MQAVSATFSGATNRGYRTLINGVLVSWDKQTASGIQYFTIGTSTIGGNDILKSTGGGTIAVANQYKYTKIPASGIVSWSTSMKLDQFPYGIVQRQADVVLSNTSTAYLPASGTNLGPYIDSGRPVIIQAGFGNETIPMFTGYSDSPVNDIKARTTSLHCYDAIDFLNSYTSKATGPIINKRADEVIAILLAEAGFATNQYILERSLNSVIPYLDPFGLMIGDIIRQLCEAEAAIFFADEAGIMRFWNRQHFSSNATPVATLSYSNIETLQQQNTPIINYVEASSNPLSLVSGTQNVYSLDQPYYIGAEGPNSTNGITNPSFEVSVSGWGGNPVRTTTNKYIGAASASGTVMTYNATATGKASSDGIGNTVSVQGFIQSPTGQKVTVSLSGLPVAGSSVTGVTSLAVSGTAWQNFSLYGNHYANTPLGGLTTFSSASNNLPTALGENGAVIVGNYLYSFGGYNGSASVNSCYYAPLTPDVGSFSLTTALPVNVSSAGVTTYSGYVYMIGGSNRGAGSYGNALVAKTQTGGGIGSWSFTSPIIDPRECPAVTVYNNHLYVLGGDYTSDGSSITTVFTDTQHAVIRSDGLLQEFNPTTDLPIATTFATASAYNGYIYIIGGFDTTNGSHDNVYYAPINANGSLGSWTATTSLPKKLDGASSVVSNGYLYVFGGFTSSSNTSNNTVYYAPINANGTLGSWTATSSLQEARQFSGIAATTNQVYIVGGVETGAATPTAKIEYSSFLQTGVTFTASGTSPFYLDAVSSDITLPYFDGNSTNNKASTYSWLGTPNLSISKVVSTPPYLNIQVGLSDSTYSLSQPVASGLNNPSIGPNQSFYSFSSVSGTGGIFGQDLTSNVSLVNYSVSGTTAFLTFQNNSTNQAYLTNLKLYGQVATPPAIGVNQFYSDQTSINAYRLNPANNGQIMNIDNDYIPTAGDALGLCQYLVQGYSTPHLKHNLSNFSIPQLQFGDCVNLFNRDTGETRQAFIFGVDNSMDNQGKLQQSLILQERSIANYFTIGTSTIGGQTASSPSIAP